VGASCRAFSRRVEHATVAVLSKRFGVTDFLLEFAPTEKNRPLRAFLTELGVTPPSEPDDALPLSVARVSLPDLYHQREIHEHA
jgi:predicted enzyme involved in methoxymalonyl-ACP biosynthesis